MATGLTLAVDIGTGFTAAAVMMNGRPEPLRLGPTGPMLSTVSLSHDGRLLTGSPAADLAATHPDRAERHPLRALEATDQVQLGGMAIPTIELISAILRQVSHDAQNHAGSAISRHLLLTAPVRWGTGEVEKLRAAGVRAGFSEVTVIPEPVAAARWHADPASMPPGTLVAVYDLGSTTFAATILTATPAGFHIQGEPGGNPGFGGETIDEIILRRVAERARKVDSRAWDALWADSSPSGQRLRSQIRQQVVAAKEALSATDGGTVHVGGTVGDIQLSRADLEASTERDLYATATELVRTVERAGTRPGELAEIFLVGGSTRIPRLSALLSEVTGLVPRPVDDPRSAVGAAGPSAPTDLPLRAASAVAAGALLTVAAAGGLPSSGGAEFAAPGGHSGSGAHETRILPDSAGTTADSYAPTRIAANAAQFSSGPYGQYPPANAPFGSVPPAGTHPQRGTFAPPGGYPPPGPPYSSPSGYPSDPYRNFSPGGPPSGRAPSSRRRTGLIVGIVAAAVLAIAIPVIAVSASGSEGNKPNAGPTLPASTTGPTPTASTRPSATASATPSATGRFTSAERSLLGMLDSTEMTSCKPNPDDEGADIDASLRCSSRDGTTVYAFHYNDASSLRSDIDYRSSKLTDNGQCRDAATSVGTWQLESNSSVDAGSLLCYYQAEYYVIFWSYDNDLVSFAAGSTGAASLYEWWKNFDPLA